MERADALRLKHDLGKAIRFNAPEVLESDPEALRERLGMDLLSTRRTPEGVLSAVEVWDRWRADAAAGSDERLAPVAARMDTVRTLAPRLGTLDPSQLRELDDLTRQVQAEIVRLCRELATRG